MSRLIKIANWSGPLRARVIFVHGLGGHPCGTWRREPDNDTYWPLWLAQDVRGISVYSVAYEAPPTNWLGTSMALQDRAVNISEHLFGEPDLKSGPIVFICHSLGGLVVKQIMLNLQQQKERRPEAADLLARVQEIVFAATPHTGSRHATLLDRLRFLAWPSWVARTLVANDPTLRSINVAYRGLAEERRASIYQPLESDSAEATMTITIAWTRTAGATKELLIASDSRLTGVGHVDVCQKIFPLDRGDSFFGFCGHTILAFGG
jgi:Putative serine esterase (DUF676)